MPNDTEQLLRYAQTRDQEAFAGFVRDNLTLVYSAAHRQTYGDVHLAQEVTQSVFIAAAQNAARLSEHPVIHAWLHQTTRNAAIDALRSQNRRREREREAIEMNGSESSGEVLDWAAISPEIDRAISALKTEDRDAVILRFFGNASFADIGDKLGLSENAARMRVERALDKLRGLLGKTLSVSGTAALAALLSENNAVAAPMGLGATITAAAVAAPAAGLSTTAAAVKILTTMKLATAVASIVALASIATAVYQYQRANKAEEALASAPKMALVPAPSAGAAKRGASRSPGEQGQPQDGPAPAGPSRANAFAGMLAILSNPSVYQQQSMMAKARLDAQYGPLFKNLKLSADQIDAFKNLIVEKQMAGFDTMSAAKEQGIDFSTNPKAMFLAVAGTEKSVDSKISDLIGADNFNQFQAYEQTIPARNTAALLSEGLSYTDTPLTSDQQAQVVKVLTDSGIPPVPVGNPFAVFNSDLGVVQLSTEGQSQLQSILDPSQYQALQAKIAQQAQIVEIRKKIARN